MNIPKCPYCGSSLARFSPNVWRCPNCTINFKVMRGRAIAHYKPEKAILKPKTPAREIGLKEDQLLFVASTLNISTAAARNFVQWAARTYNVSEELILSQSARSLKVLYDQYLKYLVEQPPR